MHSVNSQQRCNLFLLSPFPRRITRSFPQSVTCSVRFFPLPFHLFPRLQFTPNLYSQYLTYINTNLHLPAWQGRTQDFLKGGGVDFFPCIVASVGCEKSTLRKLFTMLQVSSVLPHSKKHKKTDFKDVNHVT